MLRQLARLTAPVAAGGDRALAIAVYADARDLVIPAADFGYEGVACVDDAARGLILFCDLWERTRLPRFRAWSEGLLDFLLYMQAEDGRFFNFITDWSGRRNEHGTTSFAGGGFWHARGVYALAKAAPVLNDDRARSGLERGLVHVRAMRDVPADVRAIHVLTTIELLRGGRSPDLRADLERWCDEIASFRHGDVLFDDHDAVLPHLWGHQQEGALALAGACLERPDVVEVARRSALAYLAPLIESGFDQPMVQPYGVASAVFSVEQLALVTGDPLFTELAVNARAWFDGRNPARRPVYDRTSGRVHDGIDDGVLNPNSGAESNIAGAQALIDEVAASAPALLADIESARVA
jgi:hypothetical protein